MAFCSKCGAELAEGARFCVSCGTATDQSGASPAGPAGTSYTGATAQPGRPSPTVPPYGNTAPPIITPARPGGLGWILPAIILIALGVIGYLLLAPGAKRSITDGVKTGEAAKGEAGFGSSGAADSAARTADRAADEAAAARRNALGTPNYVTAATLDAVYNADPAGAAVRYPGRVRVTGVIASMVSPGSNPSLSMEGRTPFNFMVVNFPDGYRTRLIPLMKGQTISVLCDDVRSLAGTTILSDCLLD